MATLACVDWYDQRRLHGQIGNNTKPEDLKPNDQQPGPLKSWMGPEQPPGQEIPQPLAAPATGCRARGVVSCRAYCCSVSPW